MVFYWKMWFRFFLPLYIGSHVLLILLLLFDLGVLQSFPPEEALPTGGCALGAVQGLLLLWSGGSATVLSINRLEEKNIRLFLNSVGISTRAILSWSLVPLGLTSLLMAFWFNLASPLAASCKESRIQSFIPLGVPVSVGNFAIWVQTRSGEKFEGVQIRSKAMALEAEWAHRTGPHLTLFEGTGSLNGLSFSYSELSLLLDDSDSRSLHSQSNQELWENGGRREKMEVIQRLTLPFIFLFGLTGLSVLVLQQRKPIALLMISAVVLWVCIRMIELSNVPFLWACFPLFLSSLFCLLTWRQVQ